MNTRICDECGEEFSPLDEGATETTCAVCRENTLQEWYSGQEEPEMEE